MATEFNIPITVTIVETTTGTSVVHRDDTYMQDSNEPSVYQWRDGNYSCDCNRELFFRRSKGENPDPMSTECGEDRYRVRATLDSDGSVIYEELGVM